jgi:oxalate decarboxylase/phosphoglucose isomerase-like protein (cupin superfamily)
MIGPRRIPDGAANCARGRKHGPRESHYEHCHAAEEAFYILEGEAIYQVKKAGSEGNGKGPRTAALLSFSRDLWLKR